MKMVDDFSVMFTNEEFKKFIPSSILSTQLLSWTAGINIEYKKRKLKSNKVSYKEYTFIIIILKHQQMNLKLCIDL
jgi:hypothetical protein